MKSIEELSKICGELIVFWYNLKLQGEEALLNLAAKSLELVDKYCIEKEDRDSLGYTMALY